MVYDPAWDMPTQNWVQQGSFESGQIPPITDPDAGTSVCVGPFSREWLPYVLGAMDQLRNPSSWIVADDDAMFATLSRVTRLREIFSLAGDCGMSFALRFTDGCELQFTTDMGTTWTTVDGWDDNLCPCIKKCVPVVTPPENPGDLPHDELACAIAGFIADDVIKASLQKAIDNITSDLSLLDFGAAVLTIIPEFILVTVAYDAFAAIYNYVAHGTIGDYEDAVADDTLWAQVTCAIYSAIRADGYVTPGNFAAIVANISAISYAHSSVITTIAAYVNDLGAIGLAQLSQRAGMNINADCSSCGGDWCYLFDFTLSDGGWTAQEGEDCTWVPGTGWVNGSYAPPPGAIGVDIGRVFDRPGTVNYFETCYSTPDNDNGGNRVWGATLAGVHASGGDYSGEPAAPGSCFGDGAITSFTADFLEAIIRTNPPVTGPIVISSIKMKGTGANPFGDDNC